MGGQVRMQTKWFAGLLLVALLVVPACCCAGSAREEATRPPSAPAMGRLVIASVPPADVWVDGVSRGVSPVDVAIAAGSHAIRVRLGGFATHEARVEVGPGDPTGVTVRLALLDAEEREALQLLADAALPASERVWVQVFEEPRPSRGGAKEETVRVVFPRGAVRPKDLARFRLEFPPGTGGGAVEFRRGEQVLHRLLVSPADLRELEGDVPAAVRDALAAGDEVHWGFYPSAGAPRTTTFNVVEKDLHQAMAAIGQNMAGQPAAASAHLRAQLLLNQGLFYAAHQEAERILAKEPGSVRAWAVVLEALEKMGVDPAAQAMHAAQSALAGAPKAKLAQVHFVPGADLQRIGAHIERGDAGRAVSTLRARVDGGEKLDAPQLRDLAEVAARGAGAMGRQAPGASAKLLETLRGLAADAHDKAPDEADVHWARAYLEVAQGRLRLQSGAKPGPEHWTKAVAEVEPVLEKQADAASGYVQAIAWLHEAAVLKGVDPKPVLARAAAVADRLHERFPDRPEAAAATVATQLLRVQLEPRMPRQELRTTTTACLDTLQPHLATDHPAPAIGTLHTRVVTLAKTRKLGLKVEYRAVEGAGTRHLLAFELPLSETWDATPDPLGRYTVFVRNLDDAGALQRVITVSTFEWFTPYKFPEGRTTSGENIGALSKLAMPEALAGFGKVERSRKTFVRPLSRRFTRAYHYDIQGETRDGAFLRLRSWILKSKAHQITYHVEVQDLVRDLPADDPELDFVLESFVDLER